MCMGPLYVLFGEVYIEILGLFFNWIVCLPGVESYEFFIYFGDQTLIQGIIGKYILPYNQFLFYFADVFFSRAKTFQFDFGLVPFVYFFFLNFLCPRIYIGKKICYVGYLIEYM